LTLIPGLERNALESLELAGIRNIGQLGGAPFDWLSGILGRRAQPLQRLAQGISEEPVGAAKARAPGWSERIDFAEDVWDEPVLLVTLQRMGERLMAQVRAAENEIRRVTLELVYTDRDESKKSYDFAEPTALDTDLLAILPRLLDGAWSRRVRLRALTLRAARPYPRSSQLDLFDATPRRAANLRLSAVIDGLRRRHGATAVLRGYELDARQSPQPVES